MSNGAPSYHSQGLARGLRMLRVLGQSRDPLTLAALAKQLDIAKPTLLRLLAVMERERFVVKAGNVPAYSLGPSILEVAESIGTIDFADITSDTLKELADELGFTTNLGVLHGRSVLHLAVEEPDRALRIASGGYLDHTYCTALGKMLLSVLPMKEVDEHLPVSPEWESFTDHTITNRADFDAELQRIRDLGYSIDDQERNRGVRCMSVVVPLDGDSSLAISASGPAGELDSSIAREVLTALTTASEKFADLPGFGPSLAAARTRWGIE
ncbi:IclR family transcriptional regulator [Pseudactinotalea sp. Z1748]|uniref:IclR family transcriptional regulator n=1 Tax=Pseudactinotalea sp. Z1748 TaxID=3413027 RepID=UPI003C7C9DBA